MGKPSHEAGQRSSRKEKTARTAKGKRELEKRAPKFFEDTKKTLIINGPSTSGIVKNAMGDIAGLLKPNIVRFSRKHPLHPFDEGDGPAEPRGGKHELCIREYCEQSDTPLFITSSHTKKRPHRLVFGRLYDYQLLDVMEFEVSNFLGAGDLGGAKFRLGSKPMLLFVGDGWDNDEGGLRQAKSLLLDIFRGEEMDKIDQESLEHAIVFAANIPSHQDTASGQSLPSTAEPRAVIRMRTYNLIYEHSSTKGRPVVNLDPCGPNMDLTLDRRRINEELMREAKKRPHTEKAGHSKRKSQPKNTFIDELGQERGRVWVPKEDLRSVALRRYKASPSQSDHRRSEPSKKQSEEEQ